METDDQGARAGAGGLCGRSPAEAAVVSCALRGLCVCSGPWPLSVADVGVAPGPPGEAEAVDMAEQGDEARELP